MPILKPKVAVFSKGKPDMTYTGEWFKANSYNDAVYVVSEGDDVAQYRSSTGCEVVVATGAHNLPTKRQWAVDHLTSTSRPWLLFFEDNIYRVTGVSLDKYHLDEVWPTARCYYHDRHLTPQEVIQEMLVDIKLATQVGAVFGGYACNDNHFFRSRKYRTVAFVWTKMAYVSRYGPRWPAYANEKDDYAYTAECLKSHGRVLVNNYLYPWAHRYEGRGGSRTIEERAGQRRECVAQLHDRFSGLFRDKHKSGSPPGTEVQLRFHSERQVDLWRQASDVMAVRSTGG